jgi:hypothetical protein
MKVILLRYFPSVNFTIISAVAYIRITLMRKYKSMFCFVSYNKYSESRFTSIRDFSLGFYLFFKSCLVGCQL